MKYSLCAAEGFARGAVGIISALGCVDMLSFGSECGSIPALREAAGAVEYAVHSDYFQLLMSGGKSYPAALAEAVKKFYTDDVYDVISSPNNTLAVEYIKALDDIGSGIEPVTVRREGAAHDSDSEQEKFLSASAIRKKILAGEDYSAYAPLIDSPAADIRRLETAILAKLRMMRPGGLRSRVRRGAGAWRTALQGGAPGGEPRRAVLPRQNEALHPRADTPGGAVRVPRRGQKNAP